MVQRKSDICKVGGSNSVGSFRTDPLEKISTLHKAVQMCQKGPQHYFLFAYVGTFPLFLLINVLPIVKALVLEHWYTSSLMEKGCGNYNFIFKREYLAN